MRDVGMRYTLAVGVNGGSFGVHMLQCKLGHHRQSTRKEGRGIVKRASMVVLGFKKMYRALPCD